MRISDWSSDVCSSDLRQGPPHRQPPSPSGARCCWACAPVSGRNPPWAVGQRAHVRLRKSCGGSLPAACRCAMRLFPFARPRVPAGQARREGPAQAHPFRSEEHTSELQSLMRISYAVFCLKKKTKNNKLQLHTNNSTTEHISTI